IREVEEETGIRIDPASRFIPLGSIRQKGGKLVHAWAVESNVDPPQPIQSNLFEMEWPPGSGKRQSFPEVDRAQFFDLAQARLKIKETQWPLIEELVRR